MNPEQPTQGYMRPPDEMYKPEPFKGDRIYVILDLIMMVIGYVATFMMMPAITDQALKDAAARPGPKADPAMIQNFMMAGIGCTILLCVPISILIWINMIKGKKWAFITMLVLVILGVLFQAPGVVGPMMVMAIVQVIAGIAKLVYLIMRMIGKVGPRPA